MLKQVQHDIIMKNKFIVLVGNIGVGKSTVSKMLAQALPAQLVPADEFYKSNPFFPLAIEDRQRWSLASDLWFLKERVQMALEFDRYLLRSNVVVDSGLPMSQVYTHSRLEHGYFIPEEWELYQECYDVFTRDLKQPDIIVYMQAPPEFLRKRIEQRGREFEIKHHSLEYLQGLANSLEHVVGNMEALGREIIRIDVTQVDFVQDPENIRQLVEDIERE